MLLITLINKIVEQLNNILKYLIHTRKNIRLYFQPSLSVGIALYYIYDSISLYKIHGCFHSGFSFSMRGLTKAKLAVASGRATRTTA